jgi:ribonuclease P protein component
VRDRATFDELRRHGRRVRRGPVTVTFLPDTSGRAEPPKFAFAVGRAVGSAVRRNLVRRRLRSIVRELIARPNSSVVSGTYLVACGPETGTLSYGELKSIVEAALERSGASETGSGER